MMPPQIRAKARVHQARRHRPLWPPDVVLGVFESDSLILILSGQGAR
jgi:hypothetical protein